MRSISCVACAVKLSLSPSMDRFRMSQTKRQPLFKCVTCGKGYNKSSSLRSHRETHKGMKSCIWSLSSSFDGRRDSCLRPMREAVQTTRSSTRPQAGCTRRGRTIRMWHMRHALSAQEGLIRSQTTGPFRPGIRVFSMRQENASRKLITSHGNTHRCERLTNC